MSPNPLSNHPFCTLSAYALVLCTMMALDMKASLADFTFNWTPNSAARDDDLDGKKAVMICNFPSISIANYGSCESGIADPRYFSFENTSQNGTGVDTTPFVQEFVTVAGVRYYHVIVGDGRTQNFAQEAYIRLGGSDNVELDKEPQVFADGHASSSSGGRGFKDASDWRSCAEGREVSDACANGWDPLRNAASAFTGNGTANPERVIMRQVLKDGGLVDTFEKGVSNGVFTTFDKKPKITQTLTTADLNAVFSLDMSNSDYKASTTADNTVRGAMVNTLRLINPQIPAGAGDFGVAGATAQVRNSIVTGGLFTWTPGLNADFGFSSGTYTYEGGNFDVNAVKWKEFKN